MADFHVVAAVAAVLLGAPGEAAEVIAELHPPPQDLTGQPAWLAQLKSERASIIQAINYSGLIYSNPAVNWTRTSYVEPQTHVYDRYLYDPIAHEYTVDRYLEDVTKRYGGIDSILLWPTYTNIGIDARNQFDYFRAMPGGLEGVKNLTARFKARGVRVLWAYNPWDQDTRDEGEPPWAALARLLRETGGDGFNGDTMTTMYKQFWTAGVDAGHAVVGEMEGGGYPERGQRPQDASWESATWDTLGWGYFHEGTARDNITYRYAVAPGVDRLKWMTRVCDRWAKNRTDSLQYAFFNGVGYESWENVWGIFMHLTPRDAEALRRMATLFRWLGPSSFIQDYADWEPYTPDLMRPAHLPFSLGGPVASRFVHRSGGCLWLVVNRGAAPALAELNASGCPGSGLRLYDLYRGAPLPAVAGRARVGLEPNGYGAVLATARDLGLRPLLARMRSLTREPLEKYSAAWAPLQQELVALPDPGPRLHDAPPGTVLVPRAAYRFRAAGNEIEGGCDLSRDTWGVCCTKKRSCPRDKECATPCAFSGDDSRGVDVQFPWEKVPGRFHDKLMEVGPFFMDVHLVTKADYAEYLLSAGYRPRDPYNFLVGWTLGDDGSLRPPAGTERQPVVWVSLQEARAFCAWAGKRLPHAYEWQLAAQGSDGRVYPWGNSSRDGEGRLFPKAGSGSSVPPLPEVGSFSPQGDSPHGVSDLVGYVWQYTDEFQDEHTRTVLLKGSSLYTPMISGDFPALPQAANWYFPQALEVDRHGRMMLMDDSYERAATLGFRCVADHADGQPGPYHFRDLEEEPEPKHSLFA